MKRKHPLTLLEVVIAMVLLGFLLTGLLNVFHQAMKKNVEVKTLQQSLLPLELFEQRIKHLLSRAKKISAASHAEAQGNALFFQWDAGVDREWDQGMDSEGMLYLNTDKQLCFASWSMSSGKLRHTILLDQIDQMSCHFFDPKSKEWQAEWTSSVGGMPVMLQIELSWKEKKIPFTFFPPQTKQQISYPGVP